MSVPCTLWEGFQILKRQRESPCNGDEDVVVDIVGIVDNISNSQAPFQRSSPCLGQLQQCQIWLVDDSICGYSRLSGVDNFSPRLLPAAGFTLYGDSDMKRIDQEQIKVGDILRFNRVKLKNTNGSMKFSFSSQNEDPGMRWFRLGYVDVDGAFVEKLFDDGSASRAPENMITCKERIHELVSWYVNYYTVQGLPAVSLALPLRRRQLSEIQSTIGILSNIKVKVMQIQSLPPAAMRKNSYPITKRRRAEKSNNVVFATLKDESGTVMSFIDTSGRFLPKLISAKNAMTETAILLTSVVTKYFDGFVSPSKDIVLFPTSSTAAFTFSEQKSMNPTFSNAGSSFSDIEMMDTQERMNSGVETETTIVSRIMKLWVGNISLNHQKLDEFLTVSNFLDIVLENGKSFRTAFIDLQEDFCNRDSSRIGIHAEPDVLKTLCGSLAPEDLKSEHSLTKLSYSFLCNLLREHIVLQWTIKSDMEKKNRIVKVVLNRTPE